MTETQDDLNALFGFVIVKIDDDFALKVRRVLSKKQNRVVGHVLGESQKAQSRLNEMIIISMKKEGDEGYLPEDEIIKQSEELEDQLCADLVRGCQAMLWHDGEGLPLEDMSVVSISQLYNVLREQVSHSFSDELRKAFPQNGSRA